MGRTVTPLPQPFDDYVAPARMRPQIWRLLLGLFLIALVYLSSLLPLFLLINVVSGWGTAENLMAKIAISSTPSTALLQFASFLPLIISTVLAARLIQKRRAATLLGSAHHFWRYFAMAAGVFAACFSMSLIPWSMSFDSLPNLPVSLWLMLLPATILVLGIQTLAEEVVFRGYLQQQLAARFPLRAVWMGIPAGVFAALHLDFESYGTTAIYAATSAGVFGLFAADLTARTGSLAIAWGAHFANNFLAIAVLATDGTITGLALRVTDYRADEIELHPAILAADLIPLLIGWMILRRLTRH